MENEKWRYIEKEYIALRIKLASSEIFHLWFKTDGSDSSEQLLYNVEYFHIRTLYSYGRARADKKLFKSTKWEADAVILFFLFFS
jgi:hypothetical protein